MTKKNCRWAGVALIPMLGVLLEQPAGGKDTGIIFYVHPNQAYVFVDGVGKADAGSDGGHHLVVSVAPGEHTVSIYNYGYVPVVRKVTVPAGEALELDISMEAIPGTVSGPWGRLRFEGGGHSAILLNGKTPDYYVGEADDFNNNIIWKQELLVPPGTHEITAVRGEKALWSGSVDVPANQRVIVDLKSGHQKTIDWARGKQWSDLPRFKAGIASATVAVTPVSGQISTTQSTIDCGESARLTWTSSNAVGGEISGVGRVASTGNQDVSPTAPTTYDFTASGPGGVQKTSATVNVVSAINVSFSASPMEVRLKKQGGNVVSDNSVTLNWDAKNAQSVSIDNFSGLAATGSKTVQPTSNWTGTSDLDQTVNYKLTATNSCGGSETQIVTVHLVGTTEKFGKSAVEETLETRLAINSIYFPTGIPRKGDKNSGLVPSQEQHIAQEARDFKKYLEFQPNARLILQGHADVRGSKQSNQPLSERRVASAKAALVANGVPESAIETKGLGSEYNLDEAAVQDLIEKNPNLTPQLKKSARAKIKQFILANNRRVDISLSTTGQQSERFFPYDSPDAPELLGEKAPRKR